MELAAQEGVVIPHESLGEVADGERGAAIAWGGRNCWLGQFCSVAEASGNDCPVARRGAPSLG